MSHDMIKAPLPAGVTDAPEVRERIQSDSDRLRDRIRTLHEFYLFLLCQPHDEWRVTHQPLYAHTLSAFAELLGRDDEDVQNEYEAAARGA